MRRLALAVAVLAMACGDNKVVRDDAGVQDDASTALVGCLDEPGLPLAPNGQLPCDLVPPGLQP